MAKRLTVEGVRAVDDGVVFELSRLGERFELPVAAEGLAPMAMLIFKGLSELGAALNLSPNAMAFAPPADDEAGPSLRLDGSWGSVTFSLTWAQAADLSQLARAALEHSPSASPH